VHARQQQLHRGHGLGRGEVQNTHAGVAGRNGTAREQRRQHAVVVDVDEVERRLPVVAVAEENFPAVGLLHATPMLCSRSKTMSGPWVACSVDLPHVGPASTMSNVPPPRTAVTDGGVWDLLSRSWCSHDNVTAPAAIITIFRQHDDKR
jgi:hypothetical protein